MLSESRGRAKVGGVSESSGERKSDEHTQVLGSNSNNDIGASPFKKLALAKNKAIRASEQLRSRGPIRVQLRDPLVSESDAFLIGELRDLTRLSRCTKFIAPHVATRKEDAIAWNNVAWLEQHHITDDNLADGDQSFSTVADDLNEAMLFLLIKGPKLPRLLPVVQRANNDGD